VKNLPGPYKNEDAIKADLRALAERTRKLRDELRAALAGPNTDVTRPLIHVQASPKRAMPVPPAVAEDRPKRRRKKR
jgi:hypothetical protein